MRSHLLIRLAAVATVLIGTLSGAIVVASPASAVQRCGSYTQLYDYGDISAIGAAYIYVDDALQCNTAPFSITYPVYIYELTATGWQTVASGSGSLEIQCAVLHFYTTSVTIDEGKQGFYCH
jgi:hypothetical protein